MIKAKARKSLHQKGPSNPTLRHRSRKFQKRPLKNLPKGPCPRLAKREHNLIEDRLHDIFEQIKKARGPRFEKNKTNIRIRDNFDPILLGTPEKRQEIRGGIPIDREFFHPHDYVQAAQVPERFGETPPTELAAFDVNMVFVSGSIAKYFIDWCRAIDFGHIPNEEQSGKIKKRDLLKFRALGCTGLSGEKETDVEMMAEAFYERVFEATDLPESIREYPWIFPEMVQILEEHRAANRVLVCLSGAPIYLVRVFARKLGFDFAIGEMAEVDENGVITDQMKLPRNMNLGKAINLLGYMDRLGIDRDHVWAYTNNLSVDAPLGLVPTRPRVRGFVVNSDWKSENTLSDLFLQDMRFPGLVPVKKEDKKAWITNEVQEERTIFIQRKAQEWFQEWVEGKLP